MSRGTTGALPAGVTLETLGARLAGKTGRTRWAGGTGPASSTTRTNCIQVNTPSAPSISTHQVSLRTHYNSLVPTSSARFCTRTDVRPYVCAAE